VKQSFQDKVQHLCSDGTMTKKVAGRDKKLNFGLLKLGFESTIEDDEYGK
jgi:hypothetical protein